ncbi:MAG: pilus assembly protein PilM [Burkholderiaceae bacterium]
MLGVDLSASSVKVVELSGGGRAPLRLERYAIEPIERGAIADGNIEKSEIVAGALNRAMRKLGTRTRDVALALPAAAVITKRITLPAGLTEDDYELQVESEASQYIPFAIDEVNLDFQVLGPAQGAPDEEVEVLLAASRKEKVEDRVAIAEMAGLKPLIVDAEPYAVRCSLDHVTTFLPNEGQGQVIAIFDIGQNLTRLTIVMNGQTIFERDQTLSGSQLTQDIVRLYGLMPDEAEAKKLSGDLPDNYQTDVLEPFVEQGAVDISRGLQFFFTSTPYTRVDRIYLAGGCSVVVGLAEAVAERTQVPTEIFSPFVGMECSGAVREHRLRSDAPALLVACGLAMRSFEE